MEELTHDFLSFLPAALLTLAAAGAPEVYKLAARRFLDRAKSHMASCLYILLDSFLTPVAGLFRVLLGAAAVKSLPFELVRDAVFLQYLNLAADLLVIFYISLRRWDTFLRTSFMRWSACLRVSPCWTASACRSPAC